MHLISIIKLLSSKKLNPKWKSSNNKKIPQILIKIKKISLKIYKLLIHSNPNIINTKEKVQNYPHNTIKNNNN
jgi:hypothetical protein